MQTSLHKCTLVSVWRLFKIGIFVSWYLSDATIKCLWHFSYGGGCLIMLSSSITPVSLAVGARSPDKTEQQGSMTDRTTAIWVQAQNRMIEHVDTCKNQHTLSSADSRRKQSQVLVCTQKHISFVVFLHVLMFFCIKRRPNKCEAPLEKSCRAVSDLRANNGCHSQHKCYLLHLELLQQRSGYVSTCSLVHRYIGTFSLNIARQYHDS